MKIPIIRIPYSEDDIDFIKNEVEAVLRSGHLTMSERVLAFEEKFSKFCGVRYAVGTNSGTSSLEIILRSIDVIDKTVIVPSNTYMATPLAVIKAGGRVIFADCEINNLQIDPEDIRKKIKENTKAVIVVHIGGIISPNLDEIKAICNDNNLYLIEDAAHAHGATFNNYRAGSFGIAASFSFYPTKVLTTAEGGMLTTNDIDLYKKAIILREHGKSDHRFNIHTEIGDNWRLSEIHAVLGLQQMKKAEWIIGERQRIASLYDKALENLSKIEKIKIPDHVKSSYYKYIVYLDNRYDRDAIKNILLSHYQVNLPGEVYANPCHSQPVFKKYPDLITNDKNDSFPNTEYVSNHQLCLPIYPGLTDIEVDYTIDSLKKVLL